jgi:hypothetical protein
MVCLSFHRGYSQQQVTDLYRFVDWVLTLPPDLAEAFKTDLIVYEGKKTCLILVRLREKV